jgi:hypothetical protein
MYILCTHIIDPAKNSLAWAVLALQKAKSVALTFCFVLEMNELPSPAMWRVMRCLATSGVD